MSASIQLRKFLEIAKRREASVKVNESAKARVRLTPTLAVMEIWFATFVLCAEACPTLPTYC